jgi:polyisoprenoid-binding protein YceI
MNKKITFSSCVAMCLLVLFAIPSHAAPQELKTKLSEIARGSSEETLTPAKRELPKEPAETVKNQKKKADPAKKETYDIDEVHSSISFKIRHLVSIVRGGFTRFRGTIDLYPDDSSSEATAVIDAASINTNHAQRDAHLKSADFFDVEKFPEITFKSKRVMAGKVVGDLTMHGVTKEITLNYVFHGAVIDGEGRKRVGFSATTVLNRKDFGIIYNQLVAEGVGILGDEVPVEIEIEAALKR